MQGIVSNFNDLNGPGEGPDPWIESLVVYFAYNHSKNHCIGLVEGNAVVPLTNSPISMT